MPILYAHSFPETTFGIQYRIKSFWNFDTHTECIQFVRVLPAKFSVFSKSGKQAFFILKFSIFISRVAKKVIGLDF